MFLLLSLGFWKYKHGRASQSADASTESLAQLASQSSTNSQKSESPSSADLATAPVLKNEKASLEDMSRTLFQFTRPESRLSDLVQYLESSQQQPLVTQNSNPDTGDMVIVRTGNPLVGTRYFHAQYFADENQKGFVQHMSFEFKPGASAMNDAIDAVHKAFPDLPAPKSQNKDFVQWDIPGGYILWVKKMGNEDMQDDPFNAYSEEDIGTVRVAMELEIHGDQDHRHQ
ncbi:MAG: hypothetical protein ACXWC9_06380 [Pseudobdellovibrionaceae bacterium]